MRKSEILKLKSRYTEGSVLTSSELKSFIDKELLFNRPENRRFAIFDLTRQNVLYQLNTDLYKISSRKYFRFEQPSEIGDIITEFAHQYPQLEVCAWETSSLNKLLEMQLLKNTIYVEVEKGFESLIAEYFGTSAHDFNLLIKPDSSQRDSFWNNRPIIVIKTLIYKAPTNKKRFSDRVGFNLHYQGSDSSLSTPKIEKVIVDLFADPLFQSIDDSQRILLIKNILRDYVVNFKTLLSYARNRNKKEYLLDYFENEIMFDLSTGEFYDQRAELQ
jgi:hypothetical protein